jgi:putative oxidoreductase
MSIDYTEALRVVGRGLLGGLFVVGGIHHFFILPGITAALTARGMPMARVALIAASVFQILAGLSLMLGLWVAPAALGLVVFTVIASCLLLNFWDMTGPERAAARTGWQTNLAIIGGLLIAAATAR